MSDEHKSIEVDSLTIEEVEHLILSTLLAIKKELTQKAHTIVEQDAERLFATSVTMSKAKNDVGAAKYMRFAALQGHVKAQFYLGMMFAKGAGLPQSVYHAYTWLYLAESQGSIEAVEAIGKLQPLLQAKQITDAKKQAADLYENINDAIIQSEKIV
ncbi:tetratricopeptide repeat protein [Pseudoalteromonas spongiae]|uniref:tetratricopeptide repeat protein n=1 Tax=Pseudoalteromonas spongiae TaxID=298657 RepID=UPI000C2D1DEC|nr:sel1 repeat family protein [Pseudoalteromonas spongiae]